MNLADTKLRHDARRAIVATANEHRFNKHAPPYTFRNLETCVCVVRRRQLVDNDILLAAGFNPGRTR